MLYRSRRLEALLGGPLDAISYEDIAALVDNPEAAEAEDLDYKRELPAADDKGKEELAKDVAAFANHIGGVLIVGMAEAQGVPSKVMDCDISDAHQRHLQQVVARNTAPAVRFDMRALHKPGEPGQGFLLLAVPRSPYGPHAVTAPPTKRSETTLRYPRRGASKTEWLTETDVATAYHRRFSDASHRGRRLAVVEQELLHTLPASNVAHLIVTVCPEVPGDMQITRDSYGRYKEELLSGGRLLGEAASVFDEVRIGSRRLVASGGDPRSYWYNQCELHRDGSGSWAMRIGGRMSIVDGVEFWWTDPDTVVYELLSALHGLGVHARDRSGSTGTAVIKAALVDAPHSHPSGPSKPQMTPMPPFRIDRYNTQLGTRSPLSTQFCAYADSQSAALLDDLADGGTGLVQAGALVADELFHAFGIAEASPVTRDGEIRSEEWSPELRRNICRWAEAHQISVLGSR